MALWNGLVAARSIAALAVASPLLAMGITLDREVIYPATGAPDLGDGWDSHAEAVVRSKCIDFDKKDGSPNPIVNSRFDLVQNIFDLSEDLKITANMQISGIWGGGSLDSDYSFVKTKSFREDATTLLGRATIVWDNDHIVTPAEASGKRPQVRLNQFAIGFLKSDATGRMFFKNCGDSYVTEIGKYAEFRGVVVLKNTNSTETERRERSVGVGGLFIGGKISWNNGITLIRTSKVEEIDFTNVGGLSVGHPNTVDELRTFRNEFTKSKVETARHQLIVLRRYADLPNWPERVKDMPRYQPIALTRHMARLDALLNQYLVVDEKRGNYLFGWGISENDFTTRLGELKSMSDRYKTRLKNCKDAAETDRPSKCELHQGESKELDYYIAWLPLEQSSVTAYQSLLDKFDLAHKRVDSFNGFRLEWLCAASRMMKPFGANKCDDKDHPFTEAKCEADYKCNTAFLNDSRGFMRNTVMPAVNDFLSALNRFPAELRREAGEQRFGRPWRQRCRNNSSDELCVGIGPDEVTQLVGTIPIVARKPAVFNGRLSDGWPLELLTKPAAVLTWQ